MVSSKESTSSFKLSSVVVVQPTTPSSKLLLSAPASSADHDLKNFMCCSKNHLCLHLTYLPKLSIASSAIRYLTNMPKTSIFMPISNMTQQTIKTNSLIWAFLIPTLEPFTTRLLNTLPS